MIQPQKLLLIIVGAALIASLCVVLFPFYTLPPKGQVENFETFEEIDEFLIYIDEEGNATFQLTCQVPPSKLASILKFATQAIGTEETTQGYIESAMGTWARCGVEAKNPSCSITGFGAEENFKLTMLWETPGVARRKDNHWTVNFDWVDNQSAAEEVVNELNSSWATIRSISENSRFRVSTRVAVILPGGTENVSCSSIDQSWATDLGGGSCSKTSFYTDQIEGRTAIVESDITLLATENELTMTTDQLLENFLSFTIEYDGAFPTDNWTFASSMKQVCLDLKYGRELDERYSVFIGPLEYSLSPSQLLYYAVDAIVTIDQGGQFSIFQPLENVTPPGSENGSLVAAWENLSKDTYVALAQTVRDEINSTHQAPGSIDTPVGKIRFKDALLTFARILSAYEEDNQLPDNIMLAPSPTGQLMWGGIEIPATYAYFLLPDAYVITNTGQVNQVLTGYAGYDNEALARELCSWTHGHITFTFIPSTPTSEWVLKNRKGQCRDYSNVYLALIRTAGIPTRRWKGWIIYTGGWRPPAGWEFIIGRTTTGETIALHAWIQLYLPDKGWVFADPTAGLFENLSYQVYREMPQTWMGALGGYEAAYGLI